MNDYQQKRAKDFVLPQTVYRQALYAIKDLDRLEKKLFYLRCMDGVKGRDPTRLPDPTGLVSDVTGAKASEIVSTEARIRAIEEAFEKVPEKYRSGLKDKLIHDVPYSRLGYSINTWKKWQQILIYYAAVNLNIL